MGLIISYCKNLNKKIDDIQIKDDNESDIYSIYSNNSIDSLDNDISLLETITDDLKFLKNKYIKK
jgi:hypothetical protein